MSIVLCHSGGIDSTVLLYDLLDQGEDVIGFGVDYGQRHRRELHFARDLCQALDLQYVVAKVMAPFVGSELTDGQGGVVVPNRNMVLISLAGATAVSAGAEAVAIACHGGDFDLFPDCRGSFLEEAFRALRRATDGQVGLRYPYVRSTKLEVVKRGVELKVPFDRTWSCYRGGDEPCGECLACRERREALFLAGVVPA